MSLSYEEQRQQNIKDNEALLLSLGLMPASQSIPSSNRLAPKVNGLKKATSLRKTISLKRKAPGPKSDVKLESPNDGETSGSDSLRRSARNSGKTVDYKAEIRESGERLLKGLKSVMGLKRRRKEFGESEDGDISDESGDDGGRQRKAQRMGVRTQNPKKFGHIHGVEVGRWWASRMDCSTDAIHAPTVAGISGNAIDGAYSVALSGGYPDDVDLGMAFTYTGSGGRDLKGTKQNPKNLRTAPQTFNQSFDNPMNASLKRSAETRKPVRVIRGFKLDSPYAPLEGYRYDGLYTVEKAWMGKGLTKGLLVCRYAFKRVPGQPPLPLRVDEEGHEKANGSAA